MRNVLISTLIISLFFVGWSTLYAQATDRVTELEKQVEDEKKKIFSSGCTYWNEPSMLLISLCTLVFGIIVIGIMANLIKRGKDPEMLLRAFGTPLIIISCGSWLH